MLSSPLKGAAYHMFTQSADVEVKPHSLIQHESYGEHAGMIHWNVFGIIKPPDTGALLLNCRRYPQLNPLFVEVCVAKCV